MAENKTKATDASVEDFLNAVENEKRREDGKTLCAMMQEITGEKPVMFGLSIIGFGKYHYKYASGHQGVMPILGFSPRKQALTLYVMVNQELYTDLLEKLGKYTLSKGCLYIKNLKDVDGQVLRQLLERSFNSDDRYGI